MVEEKQVEAVQQEQEQEGATMIGYALLVALIAIIALAAVRYLGNNFQSSSLTFHRSSGLEEVGPTRKQTGNGRWSSCSPG